MDNENTYTTWPRQQLSFSSKTKEWRKRHLNWALGQSYWNSSAVRSSVKNMRININLISGKLNMEDVIKYINPEDIDDFNVDTVIPHYPIMNSKINLLVGEEAKRPFDARVVVTNPTAITQKEQLKKQDILQKLQEFITSGAKTEEEVKQKSEELQRYYKYEWQDLREIRANWLLQHYIKELSIPLKKNQNFHTALTVGEEAYICDIVSGDLSVEKVDPLKMRAYRSGSSVNFEDADIIVLEDYWSPGKIIDYFYEELTSAQIKKLDEYGTNGGIDSMSGTSETNKFINVDGEFTDFDADIVNGYINFGGTNSLATSPYDNFGNIRVIRVFWKSKRKMLKVTSFDPTTGEEVINIYPETYELDITKGETSTVIWINEAWEGTLIGKDSYLRMKPRDVQYNRISNPSRCHFGIIGSIYSLNGSKPYSLVDMMKPFNYLYDVTHDRLNKAIAANWGSLLKLDLALVPKGWDIKKWFYYAKTMKIAVQDSFKEGNIGKATGQIAGSLNNNSSGTITADIGNYIEQNIRYLEYLKMEMSDISGISKQREGQVSNRETAGGIERSNLQSSYITEWYYTVHDDIIKRLYECMLETAKIAMRGRSKKFQHIVGDHAIQMVNIEGDEMAEADYGLIVDYSGSSLVKDKLETLAQAALQNQTLSFSTLMHIFNSNNSIADIQRRIEEDERQIRESNAQSQQAELESQEKQLQIQLEQSALNRDVLIDNNIRDNETKLLLKQLELQIKSLENQDSTGDGIVDRDPLEKEKLLIQLKEFSEEMAFKRQQHNDNMSVKKEELSIKRQSVNKPKSTT